MRRLGATAAAGILVAFVLVETDLSTHRRSVGRHVGDHIVAGPINWKQSDYHLNPEQPRLVKLVETQLLMALDLKTAPAQGRFFKCEAYYGGHGLLFPNALRFGATVMSRTM